MRFCGRNVKFNPFSLDVNGIHNISVGDNVYLPKGTTIYCENASVTIGNDVKIGHNLTILTDGTYIPETMKVLMNENLNADAIVIEDNVTLGHNVTILKGVRIGKSCIICNGSVVTTNIPACSIVKGIPARIV